MVLHYNEEKEVLAMKQIEKKSDTLLLILCLLAFAVYAVIFASAFAELPLNISTWHQLLLLYFPFIPLFFLELLLCRTATLRWRPILPLIPPAYRGDLVSDPCGVPSCGMDSLPVVVYAVAFRKK